MTGRRGSVAILPQNIKLGLRPSNVSLDVLGWPLGQPEALKGGTLADMGPDDHLVVFPHDLHYLRPGFGTRAKVSLLIVEPAAIHGHHLRLLRLMWRRFHRIFTTDEALLSAIPNGVFFPFGSTWVHNRDRLDLTKTRMCSLIASAKRSETGHQLRHDIAGWAAQTGQDVDTLGGGYKPFGDKSEGLAPYRYSIVIENVQERNYFTEKLIDALLCHCVPIYWGCPNIGDFIDTSGMIICDSAQEIQAAVAGMSPEDYAARLPALLAMQDMAAHYGDIFVRASDILLGEG